MLAAGVAWGQQKEPAPAKEGVKEAARETGRDGAKEVAEDAADLSQLLQVKRIYIDTLTGGASATQMRDLLMSALQGTKLFVITENEERADATLRGAAEDTVYVDTFSASDSLHAQTSTGKSRSSSNSGGGYGSLSVGQTDSLRTTERKHEAMATVRLVNKDGDVIWSTTQESQGAKFRGAAADVADRITKKLVLDYNRVRRIQNKNQPPR